MITTITNGWHPILAADGLSMDYGNGRAFRHFFETGVRLDMGGFIGPDGSVGIGSRWPCGEGCLSEQTAAGRKLIGGPIQVPEDQHVGYMPSRAVCKGRVVSSRVGQHYVDGVAIQTPADAGTIEDFNGEHFLYKRQSGSWPLQVADLTGRIVREIDAPTMFARVFTSPVSGEPWVFANVSGRATVYVPDGAGYRAEILPAQEFRGALVWTPDYMLAITVGIDGAGPFTVARRWNLGVSPIDPAHVLRGCWYVGFDAVLTGDLLRVAGCHGETGALTSGVIDLTQPMQPFVRVPEPVVPLPAIVIGPQRPIWRGSLSGVVRGNIGNEPGRTSNFIEDARFVTPEMEPTLAALFIDTKQRDVPKTITLAKRNGVPVIVDPDGDPVTELSIREALEDGHVPDILEARQCYPAPRQSRDDFRVWLENPVLMAGVEVLIRPGYTRGGLLTPLQVAEANLDIDAYIAAHPDVIMDLSFGLDRDRPPNAWCAEHFRQLVAATPTPAVSLRVPPVVVPPVVPPTKPPVVVPPWGKPKPPKPPAPPPPKKKWWQFWR